MSDRRPVLAMYDIRGKQEFIFRTNKLQEIVGGSWIIRDLFSDFLFPAAREVGGVDKADGTGAKGIYSYKEMPAGGGRDSSFFSEEGFWEHMRQGYLGEVVYDGGGNFLLLFRDAETFRNVTYAFTKAVLKAVGTLRVLGTYVEIADFFHYDEDNRRLYAKHRVNEAQESNIRPWACLPIVQVDRKTSMPIVWKKRDGNGAITEEWSLESRAKIEKYRSEIRKMQISGRGKISSAERDFYLKNEKKLDRLVYEKGIESQIAVVYVDGNNMGAQVQEVIRGKTTYNDCVNALRHFSDEIQRIYIEEGIRKAMEGVGDSENSYRIVVSAGDEINFIVNARDAFRCACSYLEGLREETGASSCAGIAVFNSHAPYADAYRIAEEACESGKQKMKDIGLQRGCFLDFHFCQGAIGVSLDRIRREESGDVLSRPWLIWLDQDSSPNGEYTDYADIRRIIHILQIFGRSNVKGLMQAALLSETTLEMELNRMYAHLSDEKKEGIRDEWKWLSSYTKKRQALYDIVTGYDMWFSEL